MITPRPRPGSGRTSNGTAAADARAWSRGGRERGQIVVAFALFLPVVLALGAVVVTIGSFVAAQPLLDIAHDAVDFLPFPH